jgi:hypothetical protein
MLVAAGRRATNQSRAASDAPSCTALPLSVGRFKPGSLAARRVLMLAKRA